MTSLAGLRGTRMLGTYAMTKAAIAQLARNLAVEWGGTNLRANAIAPELIDTAFAAPMKANPTAMAHHMARTPLGHRGRPEEIAGTAVWLASPAGAFVTGQTIEVDGGTLIGDRTGRGVLPLVTFAPDPGIAALFGRYPPVTAARHRRPRPDGRLGPCRNHGRPSGGLQPEKAGAMTQRFPPSRRRILDLSIPLDNSVLSDPPPLAPKIACGNHRDTMAGVLRMGPGTTAQDFPEAQAAASEMVRLSTHSGTDLDGPWHYHATMNAALDGPHPGATIDQIPLGWCVQPGIKLDFRHIPDGHVVTATEVAAANGQHQCHAATA